MRDIGLFVWVVLLIVGVVGSMTSSIRRHREQAPRQSLEGARNPRAAPPPIVPRPAPAQDLHSLPPGTGTQQATLVRVMQEIAAQQGRPPPAQRPSRPAPRPAPSAIAAPPLQATPHGVGAPPAAKRRTFFGSGPELVRAVIAAEVLGKPRALRDE